MSAPIVHACPPKGSGLMRCCGKSPFEVLADPPSQMTLDPALVTCPVGGGLTLHDDIDMLAAWLEYQATLARAENADDQDAAVAARAVRNLQRRHPTLGDDWSHEGEPCPGRDVTCPGFDGDQCHFLGPGAWPIPTPQTPAGDPSPRATGR